MTKMCYCGRRAVRIVGLFTLTATLPYKQLFLCMRCLERMVKARCIPREGNPPG